MWGRGYYSTSSTVSDPTASLETKYNLPYFNQLYQQLNKHRQPATFNEDEVIEIVRGVAELLLYGEARGDEKMFECFGHQNTLHIFLTLVRESRVPVQAQVIQSLTILLLNVKRDIVLTYLLSNNYINEIISHDFDFENEEIRDPYVNLLRTIAMRITEHTAALFFNQRQRTGLSYCPLFKRAILFLSHPERLARTAARTVALSLYRVEEYDMRVFLMSDPCKKALLKELTAMLKMHCNRLFLLLKDFNVKKRSSIENELCDLQDELCFIQDIFDTGIRPLNESLCVYLMEHFVSAVLLPGILTTRRDLVMPSLPSPSTSPLPPGASTTPPPPSSPMAADGATSPNSSDLYMYQQVSFFLLAQIFSFVTHPALVRVMALTLLHPHDLSLIEPKPTSNTSSGNNNHGVPGGGGEASAFSSPTPPVRGGDGQADTDDRRASPAPAPSPFNRTSSGSSKSASPISLPAKPNPVRGRLLSCLSPRANDGLTLTAALVLYKMLRNKGLRRGNLLAVLGFPHHKARPDASPGRSPAAVSSSSASSPLAGTEGKKRPTPSKALELLTEPLPQDEQEEEDPPPTPEAPPPSPPPAAAPPQATQDSTPLAGGEDGKPPSRPTPPPPSSEEGATGGSSSSARKGRVALFEDDDDDDGEVFELDAYEEDMSAMPSPEEDRHRQIVNVLGYRVKSRASLSARRGSLRTGAVTVKRRDVRRAHVAFAKKALEVLQSSSERRGLTIKLLAGLAAELLGIGADGQQTAAESDDPEVRGLVVDAYCAASSLILRSASPAPSSAEGVAGSDMVLEVFEQVLASGEASPKRQDTSSALEACINQPAALWSTVPRLPADARTLLPPDYRSPLSAGDVVRCRILALLQLRRLHRSAGLAASNKPPEGTGGGGAGPSDLPPSPSSPLVAEEDDHGLDLSGMDWLPCTAAAVKIESPTRRPTPGQAVPSSPPKLYFISHPRAFLVAAPHRTRMNYGYVICAVPLQQVMEVAIDRANPCRLRVSTWYRDRQHEKFGLLKPKVLSASEQPGGPSAPLYQLSLDFENPQNAKNVKTEAEGGRLRITRERWSRVKAFLMEATSGGAADGPPPPVPPPAHPAGGGAGASKADDDDPRLRCSSVEEAAVQEPSDLLPPPPPEKEAERAGGDEH